MALIEAKLISDNIRLSLKDKVLALGLKPRFVVILVGCNPASEVYVRNKASAALKLGIDAETIKLSINISEAELLSEIDRLNNDQCVNGILVQLPLPHHIDNIKVINKIDPMKDLDCFNIANVGKMMTNQEGVRPCTPNGCMYLLKWALGNNLSGMDAVIVGRSNIVGKPMFAMLMHENVTVTVVHSHTKDIDKKCRQADIIVAAVGKPRFITSKCVTDKSTVIDVGINRENNKLLGDADFDGIKDIVKWITPVPGGVGPMTVTFLLVNVVMLAAAQLGKHITYSDLLEDF